MNNAAISDQDLAKAVQWHQSGKLDRAIRLYEKVVRKQPRHAAALNLLGLASFQAGRAAPAAEYLERALSLNPDLPDGHYNLGTVLHALGRYEDALNHHRRALTAKPGDADALNSIGAALKELGRYQEATAHFRQALALRPDAPDVLVNLAATLLAEGNANEAFAPVSQALAAGVDTPEIKRLFVACSLQAVNYPPAGDLRAGLIRAMSEPWTRPESLMRIAATIVQADPRVGAAIERANAAWPRRLTDTELNESGSLAAVATDPLLECMLVSAPITNVALERFVTAVRFNMLARATEAAAANEIGEEELRFWCAVARQSFINGYVHARTDEEFARAQQLRDRLKAAAEASAPVPAAWLAAVGAYFPLHSLDLPAATLEQRFSDCVEALLTQQVREPAKEYELRKQMPVITAVEDTISLAVQQQYEEMPSPLWVRAEPALLPMSLGEYVRLQLPSVRIEGFPDSKKINVLIAGCGTGREPIEFAHCVPSARILAVDLSLASLGYAKRKSMELGLNNVEYARGDILKLDALDRRFDCVSACGSLQCLAEPMHGWRVLLSRLLPGGLMRVSIYREAGRAGVVAAQKMLAGHGYSGSAEDIRASRQEIFTRGDESPFREILGIPDLFSLGECRDLLFDVNERHMTLPDLQRFIAENGLRFLGFMVSEKIARAYAERFRDDPEMINLGYWEQFERDNVTGFGPSYDFWVQKPGIRSR